MKTTLLTWKASAGKTAWQAMTYTPHSCCVPLAAWARHLQLHKQQYAVPLAVSYTHLRAHET